MKIYFFITLLLIILFSSSSFCFAQDWVKQAGGMKDGERGTAISADQWGFVYVTGCFHDTANFNTETLISNGGYDAFIAKYDSLGNLIWVKKEGG